MYAIKIPFDGDWLYVTRLTEIPGEVEPQIFNTRAEAETAAQIWGKHALVVELKDTIDE